MSPGREGSAGRVIAGSARGRRLVAPGAGTRPLADRVKQTLFAILEPTIRGRAFLDLFAGSGAAGIEALSRGASSATFVERSAGAVRTIEANLAATGLADARARVVRTDAIAWLRDRGRDEAPFAAIVVDPPYADRGLLSAAIRAIADAGPDGLLAEDGVVVAKHFWRDPPDRRTGLLASERERRFGETALTFLRWAGPEAASPDATAPGEEDG